MEYIISLYGCMFLLGLLGNGSLGLTLCCGPGARFRSPLLLGLITADFFVCCISGPITAALYVITTWNQLWLQVALFAQVNFAVFHGLYLYSKIFPGMARLREHSIYDGNFC